MRKYLNCVEIITLRNDYKGSSKCFPFTPIQSCLTIYYTHHFQVSLGNILFNILIFFSEAHVCKFVNKTKDNNHISFAFDDTPCLRHI